MEKQLQTDCSQCQAKFLCGQAGQIKESCEVPRALALKAVRISYVYPLLLFLLILVGLSLCSVSEWLSGLLALAVLALYYFVLWLLRARIDKMYNLKK